MMPLGQNSLANTGMNIMRQAQGMQRRPEGMGLGGQGGGPAPGLIERLMSGNPGGLMGALMNRGNGAVNPGMPPPPGSPAYVPGGVGPAMGGPPVAGPPGGPPMAAGGMPPMGLLAKLFPQMGQPGAMPAQPQQMLPNAPMMDGPPPMMPGGMTGW